MPDLSPQAIRARREALGIPDERFPKHVAIIMDGNGRWAREQNLPRSAGHQAGADVVAKIVQEAAELGLEALTLYSFSIENWSRPKEEVQVLMHLYAHYLAQERQTQLEHNIRMRHLGRRDGLPKSVLEELDLSVELSSRNSGMWLCLALNYGSRAEITDAVRRIAQKVQGGLAVEEIDEKVISGALDSAGVIDPDLLIRTAGEMRISNFLLWQISYAEFYVTEKHWPDFTAQEFHKALQNFANRHRRYGGLDSSNT